MTPEKKAQINKAIKRLHVALGDTKYIFGYFHPGEGEGMTGLVNINVKDGQGVKEVAHFLHNAAKQNPVLAEVLGYIGALQAQERKAMEPPKKKGLFGGKGLILPPNLKIVK